MVQAHEIYAYTEFTGSMYHGMYLRNIEYLSAYSGNSQWSRFFSLRERDVEKSGTFESSGSSYS